MINRIEHDRIPHSSHRIIESNEILSDVKHNDEQLLRILQFGRELHALKQQLINEYGENVQHDKLLRVFVNGAFFFLYLKLIFPFRFDYCNFYSRMHLVY